MFTMNLSTLIYTLNNIIVIAFSIFFSFTNGLRIESGNNQGPTYSSELLSSGSDDDSCIVIGAFFYSILLIIRLINFKTNIGKKELLTCCCLFFLQLLWLALIEVGSVYETITIDHNMVLLFWLLAYYLSPVFAINARINAT